MYDLSKIDLGMDEAEQDQRLQEYFLETKSYQNALEGKKTIIIGRKGSGKSAIFKLMMNELPSYGSIVIPLTPDQYSWRSLKDYEEQGILKTQAHTNAWKMTLLASVVCKLNEVGLVNPESKLSMYYKYMRDAYTVDKNNWLVNIVGRLKELLNGIETPYINFNFREPTKEMTPLRITEDLKNRLIEEWPNNKKVNIIIDRLDDSWDASEQSKDLIIGLLKAANEINSKFNSKIIVTIFLRSDIYDNLFFDDQDKLRQLEETLYWSSNELKAVICQRVKVSLGLPEDENEKVWNTLFSTKLYRSQASAEKYIIDRTFKRPRDIISFVRFAIETAIQNNHSHIETTDTREAEEKKYSQSKYKDLIIEHNKQVPYIKDILDSLSGSLHKLSKIELLKRIDNFKEENDLSEQNIQILRQMFIWGVIGIKRQGRAGVNQRGGTSFHYYYDDPSINPLAYSEYYIHPSLRYYLNISEKRERL
jgi:hypothetical protein